MKSKLQSLNPESSQLVKGNTAFAIDLYKAITKPSENVFFSPYSISIALAMTFIGARGETERQMAEVLHFPTDGSLHPQFEVLAAQLDKAQEAGHVVLRSANSLYPQISFPILPSFSEMLQKHYGMTIDSLDYINNAIEAGEKINAWVEDNTEHKIKNLIAPGVLTALTRLVLVNAIYFKGDWAHQFDKEDTQVSDFWITPQKSVQTELMSQTSLFDYGEMDGMQLLQLPYGDRFSMLVLLPQAETQLETIEGLLNSNNLHRWRDSMETVDVDVRLPRFKLEYSLSLSDVLTQLGMEDAFNPSIADFSGMNSGLFISDVLHKAFVEVNEEGSEAAAATAVVMCLRSSPRPNPQFTADRPFLFLIQENSTGSILFMGKLANPIG